MRYVLESPEEFSRLEDQAKLSIYDYREELADLDPKPGQRILDAGCGSGIISRYIAGNNPSCSIVACDAAAERLREAESHSKSLKNIEFKEQNLTELDFPDNHFDWIVCRYVIEHIYAPDRDKAVREIYRCLKPGGIFLAIDFDGLFHNIFPVTEAMSFGLQRLLNCDEVDLLIGRKMPVIFRSQGFQDVTFKILTKEVTEVERSSELEIIKQRFENAENFIRSKLGADQKFEAFKKDYLSTAGNPSSVVFYNKFIVKSQKTRHLEAVKDTKDNG